MFGNVSTSFVSKFTPSPAFSANALLTPLNKFCEISKKSGLDIEYKSNIKEKIWEKFIFLSAYSGITTLTKKSIGEIFDSTALKENFVNAMIETYNLSKFFNVKFNILFLEILKIKRHYVYLYFSLQLFNTLFKLYLYITFVAF